MKRPRLPLVFLLLAGIAGLLLLPACTTVAPPPHWNAAAAASAFRADLGEARLRAWQTALEIIDAYDRIPAADYPGIAALVRDFAIARRLVEEGGVTDLDRLNVDTLVTHNPNFWRASLEVDPTDGSILLLQATLLASGGDIWRANRILMATTQLLPIDDRIRPLYLMHAYGLGAIIMDSVTGIDRRAAGAGPERMEEIYHQALLIWPRNALVVAGLIELRLRTVIPKSHAEDQRESAMDAVLATLQPQIERLFALDAISAAGYRGDAAARAHGRELASQWTRLSDGRVALGHREISELAVNLEKAGAHELTLVMQRLLVVARGFTAPADFVVWRRVLPNLIGGESATHLLEAWDRGEIRSVALSEVRDPPGGWQGEPAINEIHRQQLERELAERSFRIGMLQAQPVDDAQKQMLAQAHRERGVLYSRAGLFDEALADFRVAIDLVGRDPVLLLDQVAVFGTLQRDAEAEALLEELTGDAAGRRLAALELGVLRHGQGRFAAALEHFQTAARENLADGYPAILADLAARRLGRSEARLLERSRRNVTAGSWVEQCLRFLQGEMDAQEFLALARQGGDLKAATQLSEACYIIAQTELASGGLRAGIEMLEACIATGMSGHIEFRLARLELRRLAPEREARLRHPPETEPAPKSSPGPGDVPASTQPHSAQPA